MIQAINSAQNVNFNGRFLTKVANHLRKNGNHYALNVGYFAGAPFVAKAPEHVIMGKIVMDTVETSMAIFRNQRSSNGFANFNNPLTNTMLWAATSTGKLIQKLFPKKY